MIETAFFPLCFAVAGLTFFAVTAMVRIVTAVAVDAGCGRFPVLDRILVTGVTADIGVPALKAEIGIFIMIEF